MTDASPKSLPVSEPGTGISAQDSPDPNKKTDAPLSGTPDLNAGTDTQASQHFENIIGKVRSAEHEYLDFSRDKYFKPTFQRAVQEGLALIRSVLMKLQKQVTKQSTQTPSSSFASFNTTMASLKDILKQLSNAEDNERFQCYKDYVKGKSDNLVETLVRKMMGDICQIVKDYKAEDELKQEVAELQDEANELKNMDPSVPIGQTGAGGAQFTNYGGRQYNATGKARQFIDTVLNGGQTFQS